jgi:amino acid transporter
LLDYLIVPALVFSLMAVGMQMLIPEVSRAGWIVGVALLMLAINWAGIKVAARVNAASVIAQVVIVVGVMALLLMAMNQGMANGARLSATPFWGEGPGIPWAQLLAGASVAVMTFLGFDAVSTLAEEVKDPNDRHTVSRAILAVLAIAALLYVVMTWIVGSAMAAIELKDPAAAIFELLAQTVGPWAPVLLAWVLGIVVGFTNTLPMLAGVARILMAMGRERQLPAALGWVHAGTGVPRVATVFSTVTALLVALWLKDRIELLASIISFGALIGFLMLQLAVLVHFQREPAGRHVFFHRVVPVVGIVSVLAILSGMHAVALQVGLAWVLVGAVYGLYLRRSGRTVMHI